MDCREACAACCIAPSITQSIAGMPAGKVAGEPCHHLDPKSLQCRIWQQQDYPDFCRQFKAEVEFCGNSRDEALSILADLEVITIVNQNKSLAVLYSFRRCPYAMRARLALQSAQIAVELREVVLKQKPSSMLTASPKGTVPVLVLPQQTLEQSLDIIEWALGQNDPDRLLRAGDEQGDCQYWIARCDGEFKTQLDRYKYPNRFSQDADFALGAREQAEKFIADIERQLDTQPYLLGARISVVDIAILPFIRQFAHVDKHWFDHSSYVNTQRYLADFLNSALFNSVMQKYPQWQDGDVVTVFPQS